MILNSDSDQCKQTIKTMRKRGAERKEQQRHIKRPWKRVALFFDTHHENSFHELFTLVDRGQDSSMFYVLFGKNHKTYFLKIESDI